MITLPLYGNDGGILLQAVRKKKQTTNKNHGTKPDVLGCILACFFFLLFHLKLEAQIDKTEVWRVGARNKPNKKKRDIGIL